MFHQYFGTCWGEGQHRDTTPANGAHVPHGAPCTDFLLVFSSSRILFFSFFHIMFGVHALVDMFIDNNSFKVSNILNESMGNARRKGKATMKLKPISHVVVIISSFRTT